MMRALCAPKVYMSYERASWVNCGGFQATAALRAEPGYAICTMMGLRATPAAAMHARGLQKYKRTGWVACGGVEARRARRAGDQQQYDN